ncbi:LysR substrate-binding domain-containing protein [Metallibacterium scheffleri]|uniref:LysR family transcriptional regulator n=1 Tax=Metallibacterium scheffleri TaxID=993689 RepID=A0A4S3KMJ8_9GAMM|nr:LysR substrate-binding domain-containing protein [Metallibacterium scheffleri]THD10133.1 LysR family transcriptional regulator [Metallibacterium scheffleri]
MSEHLPSLNRLRAFEAAARLGSFAAAAVELHVTPAAISQKVRLLEDGLGFPLFKRHANALELTDQGRAYQPGLQSAFAAITRLTDEVRAMRAGPVLTVGVAPALAMHWLIPRLATFNRDHPDIEVRIATGGLMNPLRDDWTCTVRRGNGDWPGYTAEELFPSTLVAVCTRALARQLHKQRDLRKVPVVVVAHLRSQWDWWFKASGVKSSGALREVSFGSSAMAVQAALDGVGVLVAQLPYISDALASGLLVAPFGVPRQRYENWYLAFRAVRTEDAALGAFRQWLHSEAQRQMERYPIAPAADQAIK